VRSKSPIKVLPGLDIRHGNSQLVAAGSIGVKGLYEIDADSPIAMCPSDLLVTVFMHPALPKNVRPPTAAIVKGTRNETMFKSLCGAGRANLSRAELLAFGYGLNSWAEPKLDAHELQSIVSSAFKYQTADSAADASSQAMQGDGAVPGSAIAGQAKPASYTRGKKKKPAAISVLFKLLCDPGEYADYFALDRFRNVTNVVRQLDFLPTEATLPAALTDTFLNAFRVHVLKNTGEEVPMDETSRLVELAAARNSYHPLVDFFKSLKWDQVPRVDSLLETFGGAEATPVAREASRVLVLSLVARILFPGCKVDVMVVLEGAQGLLKSTFCATLVGADFFDDSMLDSDSKDAYQQLHGVWLKEFAELALFRGKAIDALKAFISGCKDRYRPPYQRHFVEVPRQCVFIGTTNEETYLGDQTGNRRFLPVKVTRRADVAGLSQVREQVFAEALVRVKSGEAWHTSDPDVLSLLAKNVEERVAQDPWRDMVKGALMNLEEKTGPSEVYFAKEIFEALNIGATHRDKAAATRLGKLMVGLGFERVRSGSQGTSYKRVGLPRR